MICLVALVPDTRLLKHLLNVFEPTGLNIHPIFSGLKSDGLGFKSLKLPKLKSCTLPITTCVFTSDSATSGEPPSLITLSSAQLLVLLL